MTVRFPEFGRSFRRPRAFLGLGALAVLPGVFGQAPELSVLPPQGGQDVNWAGVEERYSEIFLDPTGPAEAKTLVLPWEPARAVILAIPLADWRSRGAQRETIRSLLAALLPHVTVVGVYREIDYRLLGDWLGEMEGDAEIAPHLGNLELLASEVFSIWARDFSPLFARGADGRIVLVDPSFLAVRRMMGLLQDANGRFDPGSRHVALTEATRELQGMRGTDIFPSALGAFLESTLGYEVTLTRPPLYLLGGDFLIVDARSALVSTITLEENGGRASHVTDVLREYAGVDQVLFLENLPGDTIEHLDFVVQPIGPKVILAASPPAPFGHDRPFHRFLNRELRRRLRTNRERLAQTFPGYRIVDVPMPPPLLDSDEDVVQELLFRCVEEIAAREGLPFWSGGGQAALERARMDPKLDAAVQTALGVLDWRNDVKRTRAGIERYLGRPIPALIARHVEEHVRFRSYVNSLYLRTAEAEMVLVPRYRAAHAGEEKLIAQLEDEVRAAYREAVPNAEFRWIDCTSMTDVLGAVHCLTATIPDRSAGRN